MQHLWIHQIHRQAIVDNKKSPTMYKHMTMRFGNFHSFCSLFHMVKMSIIILKSWLFFSYLLCDVQCILWKLNFLDYLSPINFNNSKQIFQVLINLYIINKSYQHFIVHHFFPLTNSKTFMTLASSLNCIIKYILFKRLSTTTKDTKLCNISS